jgi:ABC-type multidrug transport system fused ATPase/permease subunit
MTDTTIALIMLLITTISGGFLLSIPILRNRYRTYMEIEREFSKMNRELNNNLMLLQVKISKLKNKLKKHKRKNKNEKN